MRARLAGAAQRVRLGLGINNSKLCGCALIDVVNYDEYLAQFAPLWPSIQGWFDLEGIRDAFDAVDYVGISAYVPQASTNFSACVMEALMEKVEKGPRDDGLPRVRGEAWPVALSADCVVLTDTLAWV